MSIMNNMIMFGAGFYIRFMVVMLVVVVRNVLLLPSR